MPPSGRNIIQNKTMQYPKVEPASIETVLKYIDKNFQKILPCTQLKQRNDSVKVEHNAQSGTSRQWNTQIYEQLQLSVLH